MGRTIFGAFLGFLCTMLTVVILIQGCIVWYLWNSTVENPIKTTDILNQHISETDDAQVLKQSGSHRVEMRPVSEPALRSASNMMQPSPYPVQPVIDYPQVQSNATYSHNIPESRIQPVSNEVPVHQRSMSVQQLHHSTFVPKLGIEFEDPAKAQFQRAVEENDPPNVFQSEPIQSPRFEKRSSEVTPANWEIQVVPTKQPSKQAPTFLKRTLGVGVGQSR